MIYKEVFELNEVEIRMIEIAKDRMLDTSWCVKGKEQEKGLKDSLGGGTASNLLFIKIMR